jgi:hypothetical protein
MGQERRKHIEQLIAWSTGDAPPPWDPWVLANIDALTTEPD